jgi:diacylglycerol kinase family enzyme
VAFLIVANPGAGSGDEVAERTQNELDDARILWLEEDVELKAQIADALERRDVVVACGGDGTVNAVAQHLAGADGFMGVVPGGTLNHFARDLGVRELDVALETLRSGSERHVDIARVNDRVALNTVAIGLYPELVQERDARESSLGRALATAVGATHALRISVPLVGTITADGDSRRLDARAVFIGVNRFSTRLGSLDRRERLDEGVLDLRLLLTRDGLRDRSVAAWRSVRSRPSRALQRDATEVMIALSNGPRQFTIDGEECPDTEEIRVVIEPLALRVLGP